MKGDRPAPGELLNDGPPTTPRQAASVILLRGGDRDLQILLVKRNPAQRFMGGAWVFPGGAVDAREDHRSAAVREVREEAGIELPDPVALVQFSRWITPKQVRIRFDTHFFLAPVADGAEARVDGRECVDLGWFRPADALAAYERDEILLVFPTIKHLEQLSGFSSADELLAYAAGRRIEAVEPMVVSEGETARLVLPGEDG